MKSNRFEYVNLVFNVTSKNILDALVILIIGIILTFITAFYFERDDEETSNITYNSECTEIKTKISIRLHAHSQLLRSGAALFGTTDTITRNVWKNYIEQSKIYKNLPGIQGVGYAMIVPENQLQNHINQIRSEGFSDYTVRPEGKRNVYTSIIYIEPFSDRNIRAFGYDMFSEPIRRKAMEQSRDSDLAVLSGKVILVQETSKDVQSGTLLYVPVYYNNMPTKTIEQRRAAIRGWVYSPYRMKDLMDGILGRWDLDPTTKIHLQVYDDSLSTKSLLYDSQQNDSINYDDIPSRTISLPVVFNGKTWILHFTQSHEQSSFNAKIIIIGIGGIAITVLLLALSLVVFNTLQQAKKIAGQLTSELKESEERFKILLNSTAEAIYGIDLQGICIFSNAACLKILGYQNTEQFVGKNVHDQIHYAHADGSFFDVKDCPINKSFINGIGTYIDSEVFWRADGTCIPVEYWSYPMFINGKIEGSVVTFFDITERKQTDFLLEQTRRNYETFFNTIDDFLFVLDEQGNIIHTNTTVTKRLEYSAEELNKKSVMMVHPAERREEAGRTVEEMLAGTADFCPVPLVTKSGNFIPVETRVKAGFWDGKPVIFGVTKDVSKIKLSEEKFSKAFQSNAALMAISSFEDEKFIDVNNAFLTTLGYKCYEIIGKTAAELNLFADTEARMSIVEKITNNIPVREIELEIRTKSGDILIGLFSADHIQIGNEQCLLTVMVDITSRKQSEEKIKEARNEAEKANHAKSEFLSRMSHELRTPMNAILGFGQLLQLGELNPSQKRGVTHILNGGKHLLNLINEVLDIAQIESGKISLSLEPVQLRSVMEEAMNIVLPYTQKQHQTLELIPSTANNLFVMADRQRLKQVLLNLINNAIKYNRENGSVLINTELIVPDISGNSFVRLSIADTGIGIAAEDIPKLFKPFERIGAEQTETEGTGLGLAVVKKLMDAMGGNVSLESVKGTGSTFSIELPHCKSQFEAIEKTDDLLVSEIISDLKKGTILYIEDNLSNTELVEQILSTQRSGIRLVSNQNGNQTIPLSLIYKPDLILLDLDLPDIHGTEVIRQLKADDKTRKIPVVIISADAMPRHIEKLLQAGAENYLTKPLDVTAFLEVVDKWIGEQ